MGAMVMSEWLGVVLALNGERFERQTRTMNTSGGEVVLVITAREHININHEPLLIEIVNNGMLPGSELTRAHLGSHSTTAHT